MNRSLMKECETEKHKMAKRKSEKLSDRSREPRNEIGSERRFAGPSKRHGN